MPAHQFRQLVTCTRLAVLLTAACSSSNGTGTNDTRTATLQAGDQQQGAASQAVATPPAIRIRDAANAPVAGVAVSWVVTAGGGSVTGASSETDAQGIARVGSWTLGATGTQVLEARVTGLAAVVFHATVSTGSTAADVAGTFNATGGTLEITEAGHPLQGLSLAVPSGTFAASGTIRVGVADSASLPTVPPQLVRIGPALRIVTDLGFGSKIMTLRIPRTITPGTRIVAIAYDPVRDVSEVFPIQSTTATSVTVGSRHFKASLLDPTPSAGSGLRGDPSEETAILTLYQITASLQALNFDAEKYSWPVAENGSSAFPTGHGAAIASLQFWATRAQVPITPLFSPMKVPGLYADTATLAAAMIAATRLATFTADVQSGLTWLAQIPAAERGQHALDAIAARGASYNHGLMLMALADDVTNPTRISMILVYDVTPNSILYFDPTEPGVVKQLVVGPNGFIPVPFRRTVDEAPAMSAAVVPMGSALFDIGQLGNLIFDMTNTLKADGSTKASLNRLMAQLAGFPGVRLQLQAAGSTGWRETTDTLIVYNKNDRIRAVTTGDVVQKLVFVDPAGNQSATSDGAGTVLASVLTNYTGIADGGTGRQRGAAVTASNNRILVPLNLTFAKGTFAIQGEPIALTPNQTQDIRVTSNFRFPPGAVINWSWGDGTPPQQQDTFGEFTSAISHKFQFSGQPPARFTVIAALASGRFGEVMVADTVFVENTPAPFWIITSISDQDRLLDDDENGAGGDAFDLLTRLMASPHSGLIGVTQNGNTTELFLRVKRAAIWTTFDHCCPPDFDPADFKEILGLSPAVQHPFGNFFNQFRTSSWSQSSSDLSTGTMTGQHAPGSLNYPIEGGGTQNGPDYGVRITATRTGDTMTGVITFTDIFFGEGAEGLTPGDISDFRFPFAAVRMR